ncbi:hypothetical protein DFS34DRAFT_465365 [Phlyctochytrium arcticum]|nr:hypothetical protein DFS34DRAFT_465365 [Phlyctochytrium arcticum]
MVSDQDHMRARLRSGLRSVQSQALQTIRDQLASSSTVITTTDRNSPIHLLWSALSWDHQKERGSSENEPNLIHSRPEEVAYLSATSCDAFVYLVHQGRLDCHFVLRELLARVATVSEYALPSIVGATSDLLRHLVLESYGPSGNSNLFALKPPRVHPFNAIADARPDAWPYIVQQVRHLLEPSEQPGQTEQDGSAMIIMLGPFVKYTIVKTAMGMQKRNGQASAEQTDVIVATYHSQVISLLLEHADRANPACRDLIIKQLLSIVEDLPVVAGEYPTVQETLLSNLSSLVRTEKSPRQSKIDVLYRILNVMSDTRANGGNIVNQINILLSLFNDQEERIFAQLQDQAAVAAILAVVAFCLLDTSNYHLEGQMLTSFLLNKIRSLDVTLPMIRIVLPLVVLPLIQTVSESTHTMSRRKAADILQILHRSVLRQPVAQRVKREELANLSSVRADGVFAILLSGIRNRILSFGDHSIGERSDYCYGINASIDVLFASAPIFNYKENDRVAALTTLCEEHANNASTCILLLPLLFDVLNKDPSPKVQLHVLLHAFPALTTSGGAFVTARVVRIAQSLLGNGSISKSETSIANCAMASVGLRMVLSLWRRQPRVWGQFRGYFATYIKRRRHGRPIKWQTHGTWKDEYDIEIAVITTIRDFCLEDAADVGQDLLPQIMAIIPSAELHPSTVPLALESLTACIEADITDPPAVWNVFMSQYAKSLPRSVDAKILVGLCQYYASVANKEEQSDVYQAFKLDILNNHLWPLHTHDDPAVRTAVMKTLARFPAPDLYPLLGSPSEFVSQIVENELASEIPSETAELLTALIMHECKHMGRPVFKGLAATSGGRVADQNVEVDDVEKIAQDKLVKVARDVTTELNGMWDGSGSRAPAGLRSSLAAFSLMTHLPPMASNTAAITAVQRHVSQSLRDLAFADHELLRYDTVSVYVTFWENALLAFFCSAEDSLAGEKTKKLTDFVEASYNDLIGKRLSEARVPSTTANIILSLAGLILAAGNLNVATATASVSQLATFLRDKFLRAGLTSDHTLAANEEILSATALALGAIVRGLHRSDDQAISEILDGLKDMLHVDEATKLSTSSNSHYTDFAFGYSWALVTRVTLAPSPITQAHLNEFTALFRNWSPSLKKAASYGLAAGLSGATFHPEGDTYTREAISLFVQQEGVDKVCALAERVDILTVEEAVELEAAAVIASAAITSGANFSSGGRMQVTWTLEEAFRSVIDYATNKRNLEDLCSTTLICRTRILRHMRVVKKPKKKSGVKPADAEATKVQAEELCQMASMESFSTGLRVAAIFALPIVLDPEFDWTNSASRRTSDNPEEEEIPKQAQDLILLRQVTDMMRTIVTQKLGDVRVKRAAAWTLGRLCRSALQSSVPENGSSSQTMSALFAALAHSAAESAGPSATIQMGSKRRDPASYSRLSAGSSFLRGVYDALSQKLRILASGGDVAQELDPVNFVGLRILLDSLRDADCALPPVDWTGIVKNLQLLGNDRDDYREESLADIFYDMATNQVVRPDAATSLTDYFLNTIISSINMTSTDEMDDRIVDEFMRSVSANGLGILCQIGGLSQRHEYGKVSNNLPIVAPSKTIEIISNMTDKVFRRNTSVANLETRSDLQGLFIETISSFLGITQPAASAPLAASLTELVFSKIYQTIPDHLENGFECDLVAGTITCSTVNGSESVLESLSQLLQPVGLWTDKKGWTLSAVISLAVGKNLEATTGCKSAARVLTRATGNREEDVDAAVTSLLVRLLREGFINSHDTMGSTIVNVFSKTLHEILPPLDTSSWETSKESLRLDLKRDDQLMQAWIPWLVRLLDVIVLLCADAATKRNSSTAADKAVQGICHAWEGCLGSILLASPSGSSPYCFRERISAISLRMPLITASNPSSRVQIVKRMCRLLECTPPESKKSAIGQASLVPIPNVIRASMREVLLRLRPFTLHDVWTDIYNG